MSIKQNKPDDNDALPPCPDCMICPISCERMVDSVVTSDGHTYERDEWEDWEEIHSGTSECKKDEEEDEKEKEQTLENALSNLERAVKLEFQAFLGFE